LNNYPAFKIKNIEIQYISPSSFSLSKEKEEDIKKSLNIGEHINVFSLDLKKISQKLEDAPEIKRAIATRQLPNKLIIQLQRRKAVAQIKAGRYFLIDKEGIVLPGPKNFSFADIPLIEGINFKVGKTKIGKKYISQDLDSVLSLINFFSSLPNFKIKKINVRNIQNIFFYLQVNNPNLHNWLGKSILLKIRAVPKGIKEMDALRKKIGFLDEILPAHSPNKMRYIDLRFKDIIVQEK